MLFSLHADRWDEVIERKIKYDQKVVEYTCQLLDAQEQQAVLFHKIEDTFMMRAGDGVLTIPKGSYTTAYYWKDRPYNIYFWRDDQGKELGSYFNIVGNTWFNGQLVIFEDLIIDLLVLPNGHFFVLDEDELPESLAAFEQGSVRQALEGVMASLESILDQVRADAEGKYHHSLFEPMLK
ncbi:DUF402 domain-containing protein [Bacillus pumilus]|uniref:DUF402 domain-containing protein n=1 Tax=Bacillus TaxID=1386 RepID=UPI000D0440D1|nr:MULTISPECIES: DUF402 domain-containing protein [Bacillus]MCK6165138.1 DUF402 domain-containing protein [Bacillus pumilus]MCK6185644.1 DUF402 domain-containing protein [Bacillus pumilus]PRS48702.1 DUF402 domain-containing protein [Bacillus sp. LNXM10]